MPTIPPTYGPGHDPSSHEVHTHHSQDNALYRYRNDHDPDGNPAGGFFIGPGIALYWQDGPIQHGVQSGAQVNDVIVGAIERLNYLEGGRFACRENEEQLYHLRQALTIGMQRHNRRVRQGVKSKNEVHDSDGPAWVYPQPDEPGFNPPETDL